MIKKVNASDVRTLIKSGCKVVAVPYCTAQLTVNYYCERIGYHADVYGWAYDLYHVPETDIYIVTGYRHPRAAGMIKPGKDVIQAVNEMDRKHSNNNENNRVILAAIVRQLLG